jgi:general secretion pathway protein L
VRQNESVDNKIIAKIDLHGELILSSEDGQVLETDSLIQSLATRRVLTQAIAIVWVPTQLVLLTSVFVPGKRRADWLAALPFTLEESLSEPVENFHIVAFNRSAQGTVSAGLVEHALMQKWIQVLENHGLEHAFLIADCFSVPNANTDQDQAQWNVYSNGNLRIVRQDMYSGFASTPEWLEEIRDLTTQGKAIPLPELHEITKLRDSSSQYLKMLSGFNLRTGGYASVSEEYSILQRWRWHLSILFLILLSFLAQTYMDTQRLQVQVDDYKVETETLFKRIFPEVNKIINIRVQTKNRINQVDHSVQIGPSQLIHEVENAFKFFPTVKIQKIQWSQRRLSKKNDHTGRLMIAVESPKTKVLESLDARLSSDKVSGQVSLQVKNVTPVLVEGVFYVDTN